MRPETKRGGTGAAQWIHACLLACSMVLSAGMAQAQSAFACRALERNAALPAVEGKGGMFFAIRPELQAHHSLADENIAGIAHLSRMLAANGTALVFLPVPTRAQVMTSQLPVMANHVGYQSDLSIAVHEDMILRLNAAGIKVADALPGLRASAFAEVPPFFQTDPRPTPDGARILAQSVAEVLSDLEGTLRGTFTSQVGAATTLPSQMRLQLQAACQVALPEVRAPRVTTTTAQDATTLDRLAVLGSSITATDALNLVGFLSETTGFAASGYGVAQGDAFAAMSSYLTSADFASARPRVLVWEWPVADRMGGHGGQPLAELIAAAGTCALELPLDELNADLQTLPQDRSVTLSFDTGGIAATLVRFHFESADGITRTRSIYRSPNQVLTGRFFLPLDDLAPQDRQSVRIETDVSVGDAPRLRACLTGESQ